MTSGWSKLTNKIIRAAGVVTGTFELEGISTVPSSFAPGGGAGTSRKVTGWTQLAQITNSSSSGGEQQFLEYQFLEADSSVRIPTFKSAAGVDFDVADDPTLPGYILAKAANDDRIPRAVRIQLASGAVLYYNAYIGLSTSPTLTVNQLMTNKVTLSLTADPTRYAS